MYRGTSWNWASFIIASRRNYPRRLWLRTLFRTLSWTGSTGSSDLLRLRFSLHERRGTRPGFKDFFVVDREGIMKTSQVIDRDAICAHQATCPIPLNIMVQPGQFFQIIKLTVHIVDINDNSPVFPQQILNLAISESTLPGEYCSNSHYMSLTFQ